MGNKDLQQVIKDNVVKDNTIGDSLYIGSTILKLEVPKVDTNTLIEIIERSKKLSEEDEEYKNLLEELNSLLSTRPGRNIIGLEEKLKNGKREEVIDDAIYLESKFARRVAKEQLSRTAQAVYLHCLSKIKASFFHNIRPLLDSNQDKI